MRIPMKNNEIDEYIAEIIDDYGDVYPSASDEGLKKQLYVLGNIGIGIMRMLAEIAYRMPEKDE